MPVAATPTDRLNIYLQDFERAHDQVAPLSSSRRVKGRDAFTAWREALAQVDAAHRCGGARTDANGFATPPLFALSSITITSVLGHGSAAALAGAERLLTLDHRTWQRIEDTLLDSDTGLLADPGTGSAPDGAFSRSGWGDGGYGVYWGLAEDGAPLHLVIDFGLIWAPAPAPEQ